MRKLIVAAALASFALLLQGCFVYSTAVEERRMGDLVADKTIATEIEAKFLQDNLIKYLDMSAASYEGHIYLFGEYDQRVQVDRAVAIAKEVGGKRPVDTYFLPKQKGDLCGSLDNLSIKAGVNRRLVADATIFSTNVDVEVIQCHVLLLGVVGSSEEVRRAVKHAESVEGVRSVESYLRAKRK